MSVPPVVVIVGPSIKNLPRDKVGLAYLHDQADNKKNGWAALHLSIAYRYGGWGIRKEEDGMKCTHYMRFAQSVGINSYGKVVYKIPETWEEWNGFSEIMQVETFERVYNGRERGAMYFSFLDHYRSVIHENAFISATLGLLFWKEQEYNTSVLHFRNARRQGCFEKKPTSLDVIYKPTDEYWKFFLDYYPEQLIYLCVKDNKSMYLFAERYKASSEHKNSVYATDYYRLYNRVNNRALVAVRAWALCGLRLGVMKDLRVYISKKIWESRKEVIPWLKPNYH